MKKNQIKLKLREALDELFNINEFASPEAREKAKDDDKHDGNNLNKRQGEGGKKDYSDVRKSFDNVTAPSMTGVMQKIGIPDDDKGTNRSLFRKKVKQIKNKDTGSYYQFSDEELNDVRAALDIKN